LLLSSWIFLRCHGSFQILSFACLRSSAISVELSNTENSFEDPHHLDGDPDPTYQFDADPDPSFRIKAQTLEKSAQIGSDCIHFGSSCANWF
jgi:hypothetical protein